jgi:tRNA threonylcarbamoyladenosine biosynthesis protein TsaE
MRAASEADTRRTASAEETEALAAGLASGLRPGDVVLLYGEMGAGKTTFVSGACRALGVTGPVTSPTFTLARRYDNGRVPVSHLDLHRLGDLDAEDPGLLSDYLTGDEIAFVEWPQVAADVLGPVAARVTLSHVDVEVRDVVIERWDREAS